MLVKVVIFNNFTHSKNLILTFKSTPPRTAYVTLVAEFNTNFLILQLFCIKNGFGVLFSASAKRHKRNNVGPGPVRDKRQTHNYVGLSER